MRIFRRLAALGAVVAAVAPASAADWPRFRGPNGTGAAADPAAPAKWTKADNLLWGTVVPGVGRSSPVVVGDKLFLQTATAEGDKRMLLCLDARTGKELWVKEVPGQKAHTHAKSSLASSTPAVDGDRVFAIFWDGPVVGVYAYDLAGKELWSTALGPYVSQHGVGMSPVVHDGKVFVVYDQDGASAFVCLDAATGAKKWSKERKAFRACYASPFVRAAGGGKSELVVATSAGVTGYDPDTGAESWHFEWKFAAMALRTVGSPVLAGKPGEELVVAISGDGGGSRNTIAVTPGPNPKLAWKLEKGTPYVPGPVVKGDHLYWVTDAGLATCAEAKTGKILWTERAFNKAVSASLVLVGGDVLGVAEDGKVISFKATPDGFEKVVDTDLGEGVFASPAVANGRIYIRGNEHLFCFGKK